MGTRFNLQPRSFPVSRILRYRMCASNLRHRMESFKAVSQALRLECPKMQWTKYSKLLMLKKGLYRVEQETLPVEFLLNFYRMLQDMNLKMT